MILTRRFGFVLVSILANLVAVTSITASTAQWKPNFLRYTPEYLESVRAEFAKVIHFDTSTKNPWCNTVLANWMSYDARYSQVPAGIGIGIIYPFRSPTWKIRSRYVLLDKREWDYFKNVPGLRMLTVLPGRNLAVFDNTEANCPALDIPAIAPLNSPGAASRVIPAATRKNR